MEESIRNPFARDLERAANDPSASARRAAVLALAPNVGPRVQEILLEVLARDEDAQVREAAALHFARAAPADETVAVLLAHRATDPREDPRVRLAATLALGSIEKRSPETLVAAGIAFPAIEAAGGVCQ